MNFKKLFAIGFALSNMVLSGNASNATQRFFPVPNDRMAGLIAQCANTQIGANNYGKGQAELTTLFTEQFRQAAAHQKRHRPTRHPQKPLHQ
jgi:hypothetical protein